MPEDRWGVLVMAYGTPDSIADVEPYYTHIRRGRPPSPEQLQDLIGRYERVGGIFPLRNITFEQATLIEQELLGMGANVKVYVGMKHWHPYIAEAVQQMAADGIQKAVAVVLAPHYARLGVGQYFEYIEKARESSAPEMQIRTVERWGTNPTLLDALALRVQTALEGQDATRTMVLFTAHSLPVRIRTWDDPYERELLATAQGVADRLSIPHWRFSFQSASTTGEPWIGPDLLDTLKEVAQEGAYDGVVICPVGFVADHLEILYDIDVEAKTACAELGLRFCRTASLNTDPALVRAVAQETFERIQAGAE